MQMPSNTGSTDWADMVGPETIAKVKAAIFADSSFLAEARRDLNEAVERRMGITCPVLLMLVSTADGVIVRPRTGAEPGSVVRFDLGGELTDADLDLVAGGSGDGKTTSNGVIPP